jgi:hypothetical protein
MINGCYCRFYIHSGWRPIFECTDRVSVFFFFIFWVAWLWKQILGRIVYIRVHRFPKNLDANFKFYKPLMWQSKFHTEYPQFCSDLLSVAWCVWTDTHLCIQRKNCCNYAENNRCHCTHFNCLVFVHPGVALRMLKIDALCLKVMFSVSLSMQDIVHKHPVLFHSTSTGILCQRSANLLKY